MIGHGQVGFPRLDDWLANSYGHPYWRIVTIIGGDLRPNALVYVVGLDLKGDTYSIPDWFKAGWLWNDYYKVWMLRSVFEESEVKAHAWAKSEAKRTAENLAKAVFGTMDEAWCHAACLSIAEGRPGWSDCMDASPAITAVKTLRTKYERLKAGILRLEEMLK